MNTLPALFAELETRIPQIEKLNTSISKASVGWHIQHSVLVASQIIKALEKSNPKEYSPKFNLAKTIVFTLKKIPRGKAKAPEVALPKEIADAGGLKESIRSLIDTLPVLNTLQPNNYFMHPFFGHLNLKATITMLKIHTKHHLEIINDIIKH